MKMGEQEQKQETETLTVADGEYSYSLVEQFGQQMATKQKIDETQSFFPDDKFFERLGEEFTLKQLKEEKVNGKPTYVIEATPKEESGSGKQVYYFDQKSGMVVKVQIYSPDGKPLTTMTLSNVELNVDIPAERFEFEAPEGVTVQEVPTQ
jgi:outer membrane lipoprotein-sorting protein